MWHGFESRDSYFDIVLHYKSSKQLVGKRMGKEKKVCFELPGSIRRLSIAIINITAVYIKRPML